MSSEDMEIVDITLNYEGNDVQLNVDEGTANLLLNDPEYAALYLRQDFHPEESEPTTSGVCVSTGDQLIQVWHFKGKPSENCHDATIQLLNLRQKYNDKFLDKKTNKTALWNSIAHEMRSHGYSVDGKKCHQKFANLQKNYLKFKDHINTTGSAKKDPPPCYEEIHSILGCKDKVKPKGLFDSLEDENDMQEREERSSEDVADSASTYSVDIVKNRFAKSSRYVAKPKSMHEILLDELRKQSEEDRKQRETHYKNIEIILQEQNTQRDRMLTMLEQALRQTTKGNEESRTRIIK